MPDRVTTGLVGAQEAADLLRVSRVRLGQLRGRPGFPVPQKLASGPVWFRHHIVEWAREDGRDV